MTDTTRDAVESGTTRRHFTRVDQVTVRWEPYKPDGARQMKAKGRWQERIGSGDYWSWRNCDKPGDLEHEDFDYREETAALLARAETAERALAEALDAAASKALFGYMDRSDRYACGVQAGVSRLRAALAQEGETDD